MKKDPAFLMYSSNWISSTREMTPSEKGVYIDLLCYQHQNGSIPSDPERLCRIAGLSLQEFEKIWEVVSKKFEPNYENTVNHSVDRLVNQTLSVVVKARSDKSKLNTITGTFASLLRLGDFSAVEHKILKSEFKSADFMQYDKQEITERLTEWLGKCLTERLPNRLGKCSKSIININNNISSSLCLDDIKDNKESIKFIIPKIEEIKEYCLQRKNNIDAEYFFNFYESKGWMVGKNKMKNWKSAIITWEKNNNPVKNETSEKKILFVYEWDGMMRRDKKEVYEKYLRLYPNDVKLIRTEEV